MKITIEHEGCTRVVSFGKEEAAALIDAIDRESAPVADLFLELLEDHFNRSITKTAMRIWKENLYNQFGKQRVRQILDGERQDKYVREFFDSFADNGGKFSDEDRKRCSMN